MTILGTAVGLFSFCKEVIKYIDEVKHIDERVRVLSIEIGSLSQVLKTFTERANDSSLDGCRTGYEGQHWENVTRSMEDCQKTLERLTGIIESITKKESGILRRPKLVLNMSFKAEDIASCKKLITAYRQTMQLSLQLMTLYCTIPQDVSHFSDAVETTNTNLTSRLDTLTAELKQLRTTIPVAEPADEEISRVAMRLVECVRSAEKVVSEASTMGNRTQAGSVFGSEMPAPTRERIEAWIPPLIPEEDEHAEQQSSMPASPAVDLLDPLEGDTTWFPYGNYDTQPILSPGSSGSSNVPATDAPGARPGSIAPTEFTLDDPSLDVEHELIRRWRRSAYIRFNKGQYNESEELLQKTWERSKVRYGTKFDERDKIVDTLIAVYDRTANWPKLKRHLLTRLQDYEAEGDVIRIVNIIHDLSEACLGNKELKEAKEWCNKAIRGRKVAFGTDHYLYHQSLDLLARIYEAGGRSEKLEAEGCRDLLPPKTQEECTECRILRRFYRMKPEDVVAELANLQDLIPESEKNLWEEVKENILKSGTGIIGSGHGYSLLHAFAKRGSIMPTLFLLDKGADPNAKDNAGCGVIHSASKGASDIIVRMLLEKGADANEKSPNGVSPLQCAVETGHIGATQVLLDNRANVDTCNADGDTPLITATAHGHEEICTLLLQKNANLEARGVQGRSALTTAVSGGHEAIVRLLLEKGADVDKSQIGGRSPLILAAQMGYCSIAGLLIERRANLEAKEIGGMTALMVAVRERHDAVFTLLCGKGADVNSANDSGLTSLMLAATLGHLSLVQQLIGRGASIESKEATGLTALMLAAATGSDKVVAYLLQKGAKVKTKTKEGRDSLDLAKLLNQKKVKALLKTALPWYKSFWR